MRVRVLHKRPKVNCSEAMKPRSKQVQGEIVAKMPKITKYLRNFES